MGRFAALILAAAALLPCALALPQGLTAVVYGMSTCPHCLHMKEVLSSLGVPFAFVDVLFNSTGAREYVRLYSSLVGSEDYSVPFTFFLVNGTAKLAVVGAVEPQQLERLLHEALGSPGLLVAVPSGGNWSLRAVTDEAILEEVERATAARAPAVGEVKLVTALGTPLAGAEVEVACGNERYRALAGADGSVQLRCRSATVRVLSWMGAPLNYTATAVVGSRIQVPGAGRVTVVALDLLGRPVPGADVEFRGRWATIKGSTGGDGALTADIPAGAYTLAVREGNKVFEQPIEVPSGGAVRIEAKLDLLFAVGGVGVGARELAVAAAVAAALGALYALARRRRAPVEGASGAPEPAEQSRGRAQR